MSFRTWTDIFGHRSQVDILRRICASAQPAHAYIFEGPDGVGKRTVAWALATRLTCESPDPERGGCGECRSCHALLRGEHPDVTLLERDGASIRIQQVRDCMKPLRFEPVLGRAKVLIIDEADKLREEAANALLKTLEEPPSATHFILVTARPQLLITTIRSRSQAIRFGDLDAADIEAVLRGEDLDPALTAMAAPLAEGSVARARTLCDPDWLAAIDRLTRFVLGLGAGNPLRIADAVAGLGSTLEGLSLHEGPEDKPTLAAPTSTLADARALARSDRRGSTPAAGRGAARGPTKGSHTGGNKTGGKAAGASGPLKGLDRVGLRWALDVTRTVLRDAMVVAAGLDQGDVPLSRHGDGLRSLAARAAPEAIARAIDVCINAEAGLVLNPNPRLALEAVWLDVDRLLR